MERSNKELLIEGSKIVILVCKSIVATFLLFGVIMLLLIHNKVGSIDLIKILECVSGFIALLFSVVAISLDRVIHKLKESSNPD